MDKSIKIK